MEQRSKTTSHLKRYSDTVQHRELRSDRGSPGANQVIRVQKRPGVDAFLSWLAKQPVEVSVFTAGTESYAARITAELDPQGLVIGHVRSREACSPSTCVKGCLVKDLVGQRAVGSAALRAG